eukprot:gnl/TRDRNA2_/TRDRNA2_176078_c0_seq13.p1 gnl/TRDRNA2_/TRDRNA2_176078_c0~~gnl/TRDRNA2_/TRDRNA2_176078_c0_seq13.p1  ORF type:complete len:499 (-),score=42.05 gnl/TRDRNA2_/TRDRNA2_176078_c0_seq13:609-2105(-)
MLTTSRGLLFLVLSANMLQLHGIHIQHQEKRAEEKCKAMSSSDKEPPPQHFWPHVRGSPGRYGTTSLKGPSDLSTSPAWSWHHPAGRYHTTLRGGGILDSEKNIYIATSDGIRKFSRTGEELWHTPRAARISNAPVLMGTSLFGNTIDGEVFALSLDTGKELWSKKHGQSIGSDTAYVEANNGVVVTGMDAAPEGAGNTRVLGLNAETGERLWDFKPDMTVWNVMPMFPDDDSTIFMDIAGGVYRVGLHDGKLIWHTPAPADSGDSFSDGGVILGPDGSAYTCSNPAHTRGNEGEKGALRKFRLSDGKLLWNTELPYPCISWPVVSSDDKTVVVVPGSFNSAPASLFQPDATQRQEVHDKALSLGEGQRALYRQQGINLPDLRASIMAFDTQTGEVEWSHDVKPYGGVAAAGDEEGVLERLAAGQDAICLPAHWSSPTISGDGTVYVGRTNGDLYAYNPKTGEHTYHTGTAPLHSGVTFAPGMMAYTDCDSLYVWNTE